MKPRTVLVVGAGFSRPAGGPLLKDLLSPGFPGQSDALQELWDALSASSIFRGEGSRFSNEEFFSEVWREASIGGMVQLGMRSLDAQRLLHQLTIHLSSICGSLHLRRKSKLWDTYRRFFQTLDQECASLDVVTFNYDCLVEQILDDADIGFLYAESANFVIDDAARRRRRGRLINPIGIAKLHGSANWGLCRGCKKAESGNLVVSFEHPYIPVRRSRCGICGDRLLESGIVPPILEKSSGVKPYEAIWRRARIMLRRAQRVIVLGYSMPSGDREAQSLLRFATNGSERPGTIMIVNGPKTDNTRFVDLFEPAHWDTGMYAEDFMSDVATRPQRYLWN